MNRSRNPRRRHAPPSLVLLLFIAFGGVSGVECAESSAAQSLPRSFTSLQRRLNAFLAQPRFSAAAWGVKVVSLDTDKTIFEHNAGRLMKPASNAKLYTAALALDRLGPDFRIKTSLVAAARPDAAGILRGDLFVYGRGDPSFAARFKDGDSDSPLAQLANTLIEAGVKRIEGDLVGDESCFRGPPQGSGWTWDDLQYYYGAEVSALSLEDNTLDLVFAAGKNVGESCMIKVKPETRFVTFFNRTRTSAKGTLRAIDLYRPLGQNVVYATGQLPLGDAPLTNAVAIHNPALFFVTQFQEALARRGVVVTGTLRTIRWTDSDADRTDLAARIELASVESRPLGEIVGKMLKASQNLYAQLLLLQVGAWNEAVNGRIGATENRRTGDERTPLAGLGLASSALITPSLPSDGGEGWGEEARPHGFPLPVNREDGFPAVQSLGGWKAAVPGSRAQCAHKVRGGLSSVLSPLVPLPVRNTQTGRKERRQSLMQTPVAPAPQSSSGSPRPAEGGKKTSEQLGLIELKNFLKDAGVAGSEVLLEEGSGLSRACLVTPNATVALLRSMHRHRHADVFRESLPLAAVDGTLRNRMKETKAARNVRAKTGHIRYVDTLSGYVTAASGEQLAFSIMLNNYSDAARSGRDEVDALAVMLAEFNKTRRK